MKYILTIYTNDDMLGPWARPMGPTMAAALGLGPGPRPSVHVLAQPNLKSHNRLLKATTDS